MDLSQTRVDGVSFHRGSTQTFAGPTGQGSLVLCCLDGVEVVRSRNNPVLVRFGS